MLYSKFVYFLLFYILSLSYVLTNCIITSNNLFSAVSPVGFGQTVSLIFILKVVFPFFILNLKKK